MQAIQQELGQLVCSWPKGSINRRGKDRALMRCENPAQKITSIEQSSHPQQPARKLAQNLAETAGSVGREWLPEYCQQPKSTA